MRATLQQIRNSASESAVRRRARNRGHVLKKISEGSRWHDYGPFMIVNERNVIVASRLTLEEAAEIIDSL